MPRIDFYDSSTLDPVFRESYLKNFGLYQRNSGTPNTTLNIPSFECRSDDNNTNIISTSTLSINFSTTGSGALDTGTVSSNTVYYLFAIKGSSVNVLASTSKDSPTLPSGFIYKRLIGSWSTDGSANLRQLKQIGLSNIKKYYFGQTTVLSGGSAGTWTNIDVSSLVPETNEIIFYFLRALGDSCEAGLRVEDLVFSGEGRQATAGPTGTWHPSLFSPLFTENNTTIQYELEGGTGSVYVDIIGYEEHL